MKFLKGHHINSVYTNVNEVGAKRLSWLSIMTNMGPIAVWLS